MEDSRSCKLPKKVQVDSLGGGIGIRCGRIQRSHRIPEDESHRIPGTNVTLCWGQLKFQEKNI